MSSTSLDVFTSVHCGSSTLSVARDLLNEAYTVLSNNLAQVKNFLPSATAKYHILKKDKTNRELKNSVSVVKLACFRARADNKRTNKIILTSAIARTTKIAQHTSNTGTKTYTSTMELLVYTVVVSSGVGITEALASVTGPAKAEKCSHANVN